MGNQMWALILRYGLPEEPPLGDVPPAAVLCLECRGEPRDVPLVVLAPDAAAEEEVAVRRAA